MDGETMRDGEVLVDDDDGLSPRWSSLTKKTGLRFSNALYMASPSRASL